ncbi:MAG TPA: lamin tail domain-containing protein, partial [Elusimicrobiales bacterium]|nr:lamin tail domain-containing protein [Elusimicrobiales bacterium]
NDTGGSLLKEIQTKIYTGVNGSGVLVQNWTPQVQNINSSSYSLPWEFTDNTFNLLHNGVTNYVWVRVLDNAGNISNEISDAFYVKKDTVPPTILSHVSTSSFNFWTSTGVGLIDIDFSDTGGSNISTASYSVWTSTDMSGTNIASNVLISTGINQSVYNTDWNLNFSILSNGTNYISITVWDNAGSSITIIDAFKVLKDTIGPSQITNLSAQPGPFAGTVLLTFSAPADDGIVGNNTQGGYIIKYATFNIINDVLFNLATSYNETFIPLNKDETENIILYGLNIDTTYYLAIKSYDKAGNVSLISNSASSLAQKFNVFINEVYPSGTSGQDWIELYNNTPQDFNLNGWKLVYHQGPVDGPGSDLDIWIGASTDTVNSGGIKLINIPFNLNSAQSYSVILKNNQGKIIDIVQWPIISNDQSFARIYDGSSYFEIDPTPTPGYKNSISTSSLKINEVSYKNWKFIEIYNSTNSNIYINNYSFRGIDNLLFKFSRNFSAFSYSMIDQSSFSDENYSFEDIFPNLNENGGFLVLENESGQSVDRVSWKASLVPLYNYKAQLFVNGSYAPSGVNSSIIRNDGYDTDDDGLDFSVSSIITPLYRNSNYGLLANNDIYYPVNNGYISSRFPINIKFNRDYSSGYNDIIAFINTDGKDKKSPHIYRLLDLGFDLSNTLDQKKIFDFDNFYDMDGNKLVSDAVYKILFITDSSTATSLAIWITSVTADNSNILVNGYDTNNLWLNPNKQIDIFKITAYNPSSYDIYITSIALSFKTTDYQNLTTEQLKNIIKTIKLIKDSEFGNVGVFEEGIDMDEISSLSNSDFVLNNGEIFVNISTDNLSFIDSKSTGTYFVVFVSSDQSYDYSPNKFIAKLSVSSFSFSDSLNLVSQKISTNQSYIETSSLSVISPGADAIWSLNTNIVSNIETNVNYWNNVYISANDGVLRTLDYYTGNEKWAFITSPLSPIITSPLVSIGEGGETYIYVVAANGDVYKLKDDDTSYSQIWKTNINDTVNSDLYDSDTAIYLGTQNNKILCLNKSDGNVCDGWAFDNSIDSSINTDFSIDFRPDVNMGWVGLLNGKVLSFRLSDGVVLNQFQTGGAVKSAPFIDSAYSMASNNLFIASTDGKLYCRVASNLNVIPSGWADTVLNSAVYSSPYKPPYKNYILVGDESGRIYKIDSVNGSVLKTFFASYPIRTMPIEFNGWIYFASGKYIYALDENDFSLKPGYPIYVGSEVKGNLILDSYEGYLFFSTNAGGSYTIDLW